MHIHISNRAANERQLLTMVDRRPAINSAFTVDCSGQAVDPDSLSASS